MAKKPAQHQNLVTQQKLGEDEKLGAVEAVEIKVLVDNTAIFGKHYIGEHGLALLVSGNHFNILLDTGGTGETLFNNMKEADISVDELDMIFISHCHHDHTGGLYRLLREREKRIPVVAHPDLFKRTFKLKDGLHSLGVPGGVSREDLEKAGADLFLVEDPVEVWPGVVSTGVIEKHTSFEGRGAGFYRVDDCLEPDSQEDDMALALNVKGKGLVVLTGCGHAGIVNTVLHAQNVTGIAQVHAIIGGFHLVNATAETLERTVDELAGFNPILVAAGHCTGFEAVKQLSDALGNGFVPLRAGLGFEI